MSPRTTARSPDRAPHLDRSRPLYARTLRLQHVSPGGVLCFVFFEGTVALGILMALAELVPWWGIPVLPLTVAALVKVNDVIAGALARPATAPAGPARPAVRGQSVRSAPRFAAAQPGRSAAAEDDTVVLGPVPATGALLSDLGDLDYRVNRQRLAGATPVGRADRRSRQSASGRYE